VTDRRTGVGKERAIAYMLSRAKNVKKNIFTSMLQTPNYIQGAYF